MKLRERIWRFEACYKIMVKHGCGLTPALPMFKLSGATKLNEFELDARYGLNVLPKFQAFYTLDSLSARARSLALGRSAQLDVHRKVLFCEGDSVRAKPIR